MPLLAGQPLARGPIFCEATQPPSRAVETGPWPNALKPKCVRIGRYKYVRAPYLEVEQLFDLESDPRERTNLIESSPDVAARELPALRAALDRWQAAAHPLPAPFRRQHADAVRKRLGELGYAEGSEDH